MYTLIKNVKLVQDGITPCDILLKDGCIHEIRTPGGEEPLLLLDGQGLYAAHGFIDMHVHGGGGYDFMDATEPAWQTAAALHLRHGTTAMVPTTVAASQDELEKVLAVYAACKSDTRIGPRLLGLHMEGPYLCPAQCGAQDTSCIRNPDPDEYKRIVRQCPDILRWTIAPELPGALEMSDFLCSHGIRPSIGHSSADYRQVAAAIAHGFRCVTHLYSAMSSITRVGGFRRTGIVESAYLFPQLTSELIADGCHLPAELLQMAYRFIGPDRLVLITDAMRAAGQESGESILGSHNNGQKVIIEDGVAKLMDRSAFAGSVSTTDRLVRTMVKLARVPLPDAVKMITQTPAKVLGLEDRIGTIAPGRKADLVLFDEDIRIVAVIVNGALLVDNRHTMEETV